MNVAMTLTSKVAKESEGPVSATGDSVLEGSLCIKGSLSDLIKIMEAIKKDNLHPKMEMHDIIKDVLTHSLNSTASRRVYFIDQHATMRLGTHVYDNGELNKIACIKKIREILGTGLRESKDFLDGEGRYLTEIEEAALKMSGVVAVPSP